MALDQKLVVRFQDRRVLKGTSEDFSAHRDSFHLHLVSRSATDRPIKVLFGDLKGVFFVKDFVGQKAYHEAKIISNTGKTFYGERTIVHFKDGEILYGFTQDYSPGLLGFFLFPYDSGSNNLKLFAIHSFVTKVEFPLPPKSPIQK